jgi:hypothetical protein
VSTASEAPEQTEDAAKSPKVTHLTESERIGRGKTAREKAPRASHSILETSSDRDPVAIVDADTPSRVPELVPIRYGRMLVSPFTFYRGAASLMAHRPETSSSISTTSTRHFPARSSGTSNGWPQASRSPAGIAASTTASAGPPS